jgi:hypothetical protein
VQRDRLYEGIEEEMGKNVQVSGTDGDINVANRLESLVRWLLEPVGGNNSGYRDPDT